MNKRFKHVCHALKCGLLGRFETCKIFHSIFFNHLFKLVYFRLSTRGVQKSSVISEHCGHSVDSPVKLMVETSSSGGRGAEGGRPPPHIADVIDRQENIIQGMFSHTETTQGEKGQLQSSQDHEAPESCDKAQHQTSNQPCGTKLPNGHAGHGTHEVTERDDPKSSHPAGSYLNSEDNCVIANGELLTDSRDGALDAVASLPPPQDAAEDKTTSSEDCSHSLNSAFNDTRSCSERDPSTPKHSLRTFSSAALSPDDDETFSTSDRPDDLSLKPRNTYEISRRQSAPDNIPGVLSVAVADLTLSQRKQGISEIFSRYCCAIQFTSYTILL